MKRLHDNYQLLRFLNRKHGAISRYGFGVLGWLGVLACTRSKVLANAMFTEAVEDRYFDAVRKAARFARHWSHRFDVFDNALFDFTKGTHMAERRALESHLKKNRARMSDTEYLTDLLFIKAADIHRLLCQGQSADSEIQTFYELANSALVKIEAMPVTDTNKTDHVTAKDSFDKAGAVAALQDVAELLPLAQWPWYVVSGTFLGLHREGGFLAHDYDIDLGINAKDVDYQSLLQKLYSSDRFVVKKVGAQVEVLSNSQRKRYLRERPSFIKFVHKSNVEVDLFIHYTEHGKCWHGSMIHRWDNTPFSLITRELEGVVVNAPDDADRYLTENYGNWRTPLKDYDYTVDTPNMAIVPNFFSRSYCLKRYAQLAENDYKQAAKLRATLRHTGVLVCENGYAKIAEL